MARKGSEATACHQELRRKHGPRFLGLFFIWLLKKKPMYGYSLIDKVMDMGMIPVRTSTIYMVLGKLERAGLVRSARKEVGKRVRRIYATTAKGSALFEKIKKTKIKGAMREFLRELVS